MQCQRSWPRLCCILLRKDSCDNLNDVLSCLYTSFLHAVKMYSSPASCLVVCFYATQSQCTCFRTKETLATGHYMSVINILMQLRKVCNHPNLFDPRPIVSPFQMEGITYQTASLVLRALDKDPLQVRVSSCTKAAQLDL